MMDKNRDAERVIEQFRKNPVYGRLGSLFNRVFGDFIYFAIPHADPISNVIHEANIPECRECKSARMPGTCKSEMMAAVLRVSELKKTERFVCGDTTKGIVHPILHGDRLYGYLVACSIAGNAPDDIIEVFTSFAETILQAAQKELELKKLYETIRPRAIALSTVHTLHRLISSTLNLNELLPRIARLTLQVMRANRCSIKLVDSKKKTLLPKATVDLRTKNALLKKVEIGKWAPGKAVKYGRFIRGKAYLAAPLIDEDIIGVITVYDKIDAADFTDFDEEIMKTLCEQAVIAIKNAQLYKEQERLTVGSIKSIAAILESKAPGTFLPKASFLKLVRLVGTELRLSEYDLKCLEYASLLHDAGQIAVPDR
ncbi:MAG: GAF domain-containing protein [Candidatus Omnitrophica bacterium]|nr:GAF domain-containing protein [Candidatus Omnitrophota bacterium]